MRKPKLPSKHGGESRRSSRKLLALRITLAIVAALVLVSGGFLALRWCSNESYVELNEYEGTGDVPEFLLALNFPEGHVPLYNQANSRYNRGQYDEAIGLYRQALDSMGGFSLPGSASDCDIRVNLALAICQTAGIPDGGAASMDEASRIEAIGVLLGACDVLCENGCATSGDVVERARLVIESGKLESAQDYQSQDDGTERVPGHDEDAQRLEDDIEKLLDELMTPPEPPPGGSGGDESQDQGNDGEQSSGDGQPDQGNGGQGGSNAGEGESGSSGQAGGTGDGGSRFDEKRDALRNIRRDSQAEKQETFRSLGGDRSDGTRLFADKPW